MNIGGLIVLLTVVILVGVLVFYSRRSNGKTVFNKPTVKFKDNMELSAKDADFLAETKLEVGLTQMQNDDEDRVICPFCESYVDITENETCPNCGAVLREQIEEARKRKAFKEVERIRLQAQLEASREDQERKEKMTELAKAAAITTVAPLAGAAKFVSIRNKSKKK